MIPLRYTTAGDPHANEELLGEALHRYRNRIVLATKFGLDSMMARWYEALFPALEELGIGFVAFSPLANGLLTTNYDATARFDPRSDYRAAMPQFRKESFSKNQDLFDYILGLADEHHGTPSQISLAWMLCKKPWIVPIPGTRHPGRLRENAGAADIRLTPEPPEAVSETPRSETHPGPGRDSGRGELV